MKKVSKPLNGSTHWPVEKTTFTFQKCENDWSSKVRFCKLTALKVKEDYTKF